MRFLLPRSHCHLSTGFDSLLTSGAKKCNPHNGNPARPPRSQCLEEEDEHPLSSTVGPQAAVGPGGSFRSCRLFGSSFHPRWDSQGSEPLFVSMSLGDLGGAFHLAGTMQAQWEMPFPMLIAAGIRGGHTAFVLGYVEQREEERDHARPSCSPVPLTLHRQRGPCLTLGLPPLALPPTAG